MQGTEAVENFEYYFRLTRHLFWNKVINYKLLNTQSGSASMFHITQPTVQSAYANHVNNSNDDEKINQNCQKYNAVTYINFTIAIFTCSSQWTLIIFTI